MNKLKLIFYISIMLLMLAGCNDEDNVSNPPDNAPAEGNTSNTTNDQGTKDNNPGSNNNNTTGENSTDTNNNTVVDDQDDRNETANDDVEALFPFTSFDLDIEYEGNQEFDVDYDNERDGMEAEIKDDINNENLSGDEAFEKLRPIFEEFTFDKNTEKATVISEVLSAFSLDSNYIEFELEVQYIDGTEIEYNG